MKKGLAAMAVMVLLIVAGTMFIAVWMTAGPRRPGTWSTPDLSFKPFTLDELLHNKTSVDLATSGRKIHSAKFEQIKRRTSRLRGLPLKKDVPLVEASEGLVKYQLLQSSLEDESVRQTLANEKVLKALGLLAPDDSLSDIITAVLTEQIAGTYDTETKQITIVKGKVLSGAFDEITMSHEVCHALQDQTFDLEKPPLEDEAYDSDRDTAVQCLIEGDATDTMYAYAKAYVSAADLIKMQREASKTESPELDRAPPYIRKGLLLPYDAGYAFVSAIKEDTGGSVATVDGAFRDPPMSTRQILHPEEFLSGKRPPVELDLPDLENSLGKGWKNVNTDTLGEWDFRVWFEQFTTEATGADVGDGWAGNEFDYYQGPGKNYVLPMQTVWQEAGDARVFFDEYPRLLKGRFGAKLEKLGETPASYAFRADGVTFYCGMSGNTTLALQATDPSKLEAALRAFPQMAPVSLTPPARGPKPGSFPRGGVFPGTCAYAGALRPGPRDSVEPVAVDVVAPGYPLPVVEVHRALHDHRKVGRYRAADVSLPGDGVADVDRKPGVGADQVLGPVG